MHGFAPPAPRASTAEPSRSISTPRMSASDILADPTARFEAATVVLLASFCVCEQGRPVSQALRSARKENT